MEKIKTADISDVFSMFEDSVSNSDIFSAKCLSSISSSIVKKRIALNMSQKEFAEKLGVSQGMVSKWESEDYNFSIKTLVEISTKLNMNLYVEMVDEDSSERQYITNNTYNCVSSKQAEFTNQKVVSISSYKSDINKSKKQLKEM